MGKWAAIYAVGFVFTIVTGDIGNTACRIPKASAGAGIGFAVLWPIIMPLVALAILVGMNGCEEPRHDRASSK